MSDHDESDPFGETRSAEDPLGPFEAFKAARAKDPAAPEPFPDPFPGQYEAEPTAVIMPEPGPVPGDYGNEYTTAYPTLPPGQGYEYPGPVPMGDPGQGSSRGHGRGRTRSVALLGVVAVLAVGLGVGVYAATHASSDSPGAASPGATASAPASPGASKAAKGARVETVRLSVTAVNGDSFTGTTPGGASVTARIATATKFGTAARPFTRSQLVPGAVVFARLRKEADGAVVATVIASGTSDKPSGGLSDSPPSGA